MRRAKIGALVVALAVVTMGANSCGDKRPDAERRQSQQTSQLQEEAARQVGMPEITNFQELRFAHQIMELRDAEITTYSYVVDERGNLHFVCQSIGYGLPYSTQMTNPMKIAGRWHNEGVAVTPQPEPNGLYMPDNVEATWILCVDESEGDVDPIYSEPRLLVSPFKLREASSYYDAQAQAAEETPGLSTEPGS